MIKTAEVMCLCVAETIETTPANLAALQSNETTDGNKPTAEDTATVPQVPAPGEKCLVVIRRAFVAVLRQGRGREFELEVRRMMAEARGKGWESSDTEILIVPADCLAEAIRKAKGALDPAQYLDDGRGCK